MNFMRIIPRFLPYSAKVKYRIWKEKEDLAKISPIKCNSKNLKYGKHLKIDDIFESEVLSSVWNDSKHIISHFNIPDGTGGVNPGDRKALFYLICALKPSSVLEIGTHIGASTIHIAAALHKRIIESEIPADLTTVDIENVNSERVKPWIKYGCTKSPYEMIKELGFDSFVTFITDNSCHFASDCSRKFDFIFLDGDHSATSVYKEIPIALSLLKPDGVILLHDYFPKMKPLWSNGAIIPGPYLATERLIREGANLNSIPLGSLPWPTKHNSTVTSLSLLCQI